MERNYSRSRELKGHSDGDKNSNRVINVNEEEEEWCVRE